MSANDGTKKGRTVPNMQGLCGCIERGEVSQTPQVTIFEDGGELMKEQIIQILERDVCAPGPSVWKVRTVIQLWPNIPEERARLNRFIDEDPNEPKIAPVEDAELLQKTRYSLRSER